MDQLLRSFSSFVHWSIQLSRTIELPADMDSVWLASGDDEECEGRGRERNCSRKDKKWSETFFFVFFFYVTISSHILMHSNGQRGNERSFQVSTHYCSNVNLAKRQIPLKEDIKIGGRKRKNKLIFVHWSEEVEKRVALIIVNREGAFRTVSMKVSCDEAVHWLKFS